MLNRLMVPVGAAALLTGCSVYGNLEELQNTDPQGIAFTKALAKEYQKFSEFEMFKMYDYVDADHFARKGLRAAGGEMVPPEEPADWRLPKDRVGVLTAARERLMKALDGVGREKHPMEAAVAQAKFDCWVEQQEENHQPEHIAGCMREFAAAMKVLETKMEPLPPAPKPGPKPEPMMAPASFVVFFGFDDASISGDAAQVLDLVNSKFDDYKDGQIMLVGHADTAGAADYNEHLSLKRANNVRSALIEMGIPASRIGVEAKGEVEPLEVTGNGVRNPQNRRVEITIE